MAILEISPEIERELQAEAHQRGIDVSEVVANLLRERGVSPLLRIDERGVAYIRGSRIKVEHIATEATFFGYSPEEIQKAHEHLSMAQVHAALAYYYANREIVDAQIAAHDAFAESMRIRGTVEFQEALLKR